MRKWLSGNSYKYFLRGSIQHGVKVIRVYDETGIGLVSSVSISRPLIVLIDGVQVNGRIRNYCYYCCWKAEEVLICAFDETRSICN